jgi:uncharacterized membrane protein YeiH
MHEALLNYTVVVLDGVGTLVFAVSGGLPGVRKRFDLFGILFLSFVVAVTGGVMRDLFIGAVPPAAITQIRYVVIAVCAGFITFFWSRDVEPLQRPILLLDAVGLGLFAVVGTEKAIAYHIHPVMAALLGMLSGIGGGMARDVLAGDTPFVLRSDLYALAALAAAAVVSASHAIGAPAAYAMVLGAALCIFLRMMAIYRGWRAPVPREGSTTPG